MKEQQEPLLTICIPAYNRPKNLAQIFEQIIPQNSSRIIILVADDKSPDEAGMKKVFEEYLTKLPNLIYHRNNENLGYSGNVCNLYELAETRYIWFLCDDDTILPGAIEKVLKSLDELQPVVAVYNFKQVDAYGALIEAGVKQIKGYFSEKDFGNYDALLRTTFLSIVVVEKRVSVEAIKNTNYRDNVFFQITLAILLLSDKFAFYEIPELIIERNVGFKYGDFAKFYLVDQLKAADIIQTNFSIKKFSDFSKKNLFTAFKLYLSQKLGLFSYKTKPSKDTLKYIYKYYGLFYCFIILMFIPIYFVTPTFILKFIYFIMLIRIHGFEKAEKVFKDNVNRAYTDERKTAFTQYR